jgi:hypothetical protein
MLPSDEFGGLEDYIDYLRNEIRIGAFDIKVNGGAQFRRMMMEVEIFLRFSEIAVDVKKKDVIQARGVSMSSLTWRDVVVKLLGNEAHLPLVRQVNTWASASSGSSRRRRRPSFNSCPPWKVGPWKKCTTRTTSSR